MDPKLGLRVSQLVAGMIARDNRVLPSESRFLNRVLARLGQSVHGVDDVLPIVDETEAAAEFGQLPAEVRSETLELLLEAALADGEVVEAERELLVAVAAVMGASRDEIDAAIARRAADRG